MALDHLQQAADLGFDPAAVHAARGMAYLALGDYTTAREDLDASWRLDASRQEVLLALARADYLLGDYTAAQQMLSALGPLTSTPELTSSYLALLGWMALRQGSVQRALATFSQLTRLTPQDPHVFNALGWAAFAAGDCAMAQTAFEQALELSQGEWIVSPSDLATPQETPQQGLEACLMMQTGPVGEPSSGGSP